MSRVLDASEPESLDAAVTAAVEAVRAGDIVVLPTDTVYGVGADAFDAAAVAKVLAAKGRGREMPPPVLIPSAATADGLARDIPEVARELMADFWPGPLTVVLTAQSSLLWDLGDTNGTVALRVPDNTVALAILRALGPMAVTSANATGQPPATTAAGAQEQLGEAVAVYVDGGPAAGGPASTIVDCTGPEPVVLRPGPVSQDQIDEIAARVRARAASGPVWSSAVPDQPVDGSQGNGPMPAGGLSEVSGAPWDSPAASPAPARGGRNYAGPRIAGRRRR